MLNDLNLTEERPNYAAGEPAHAQWEFTDDYNGYRNFCFDGYSMCNKPQNKVHKLHADLCVCHLHHMFQYNCDCDERKGRESKK